MRGELMVQRRSPGSLSSCASFSLAPSAGPCSVPIHSIIPRAPWDFSHQTSAPPSPHGLSPALVHCRGKKEAVLQQPARGSGGNGHPGYTPAPQEVWRTGSEMLSDLPKVPQLSRGTSGLPTPVLLTPEAGPFLHTPQTPATTKQVNELPGPW